MTQDEQPASAESAGRQPSGSAPASEADDFILAGWAATRGFSATHLRPGYDQDEVDAFRDDIRDTFLGIRKPSLTPDQIRHKRFSTTRLRRGYDELEVDAFLDEAGLKLAARVSARRRAPAAQQRSVPADPAAAAVPIRCLECGAGSAEATEVCARCGAPIVFQPSTAADPAAGEPGDPIASRPGDAPYQPYQPAHWRTEAGRSRRNALVLVGAGLVVLAAIAAVIATSSSSTPSASSASASSASPASPVLQVTVDQLQPGDCLQGSDLGLGTGSSWPDLVTVVPCTHPHIAEVFFSGDAWPQHLAYPGDDAVGSQGDDRCASAFAAYVAGNQQDLSAFTYDSVLPDRGTWSDGDRSLQCVAYESTARYPGGAPVSYSIKGSRP